VTAGTQPDIAAADMWPDIAVADSRTDIAVADMRSDIAVVGIVIQAIQRARYNTEVGIQVPMDSRKWYCHTVVPHMSVNN